MTTKNFEYLPAKDFNFSAIDSCTLDDDNRASVWKCDGVYQVGGFCGGVHFRTAHRTKRAAYISANRIKKGV